MDNMETDERGSCPSGGGVRPFVQSVKQSGPHRYTPARAAAFQLLWTYIVGVVGLSLIHISPVLAEAVARIYSDKPVSTLFV